MADDLSKVPFTIRLSRAARRTVWQNISFALGVKVLATLLVFPGWLTLWMAVLVDTGGSLLVIGNGLRLLRHEKERGVPALETSSAATPAGAASGLPARAKRRVVEKPITACAISGCACGLDDHEPHPGHDRAHDDHSGCGSPADHEHAPAATPPASAAAAAAKPG
jgi:hypothetical protein